MYERREKTCLCVQFGCRCGHTDTALYSAVLHSTIQIQTSHNTTLCRHTVGTLTTQVVR